MPARTVVIAVLVAALGSIAGGGEKDEKLFDDLTSHEWGAQQEAKKGFGYKEVLQLRRDGTYRWEQWSDYQERGDRGTWSLTADENGAGLLRLSASGETPASVSGDKLLLLRRPLVRGKRIEYAEKEKKLRAADLKAVAPTESFQRLTSTAWVKTNDFDDFRLPQRIEFDVSGRYTASYRDGACRHGGSWSLLQESGRTMFASDPDKNDCDQRGGTAGLSGDRLIFADELVLLSGAPYAPADKRPKRSLFLFDRYAGTVRTRGEYDGQFRAGRPIRIDLLHESPSGGDFTLLSLEVGFQKCRVVPRGIQTEGEPQWLASHDFSEQLVTADKPVRHAVELTPPFAGEALFLVRLKYKSDRQPFDGYQTYHTAVLEK